MKSGLNPAGSMDKLGWEIYIAFVPDQRRLRALHGASQKWWLRCDHVRLLHRSFGLPHVLTLARKLQRRQFLRAARRQSVLVGFFGTLVSFFFAGDGWPAQASCCCFELKKVAGYARLYAGVGISSVHQRRSGNRLLWLDQGHERLRDRRNVRPPSSGLHSIQHARPTGFAPR